MISFSFEKIKSRMQKGEGKNERNILPPLIWPIYQNLVHIISITTFTDLPKVWTRMKHFFFLDLMFL